MNDFKYITFFDADNSIFNIKIKNSFLQYFFLETLPSEIYAKKIFDNYIKRINLHIIEGASEFVLNKIYFKNFSGMPEKLMQEIAYSWFYKLKLEMEDKLYNLKTIFEIKMHKKNNAQIVLLTSSFFPCLEPFINEFTCDAKIFTELEVLNGYYTGNIISDPISEFGKVRAIKDFVYQQKNSILKSPNKQENKDYFCDIWPNEREEIYQ